MLVMPPFRPVKAACWLFADHTGVDLDGPTDVTGRIGLGLDLLEGVRAEGSADRFPRAFGQVTPT
ncbi:hypothetical protein [Streptomyces sp. NPDC005498]|uniref:hypothetical protein n=1 Tax=Streptomyces sp. NPDC005498 TaxID=3364717 RepID=UPI0036C2CCDA